MFGSAKIDLSGYLTDVQINGTSIVENGVANVPTAEDMVPGVVRVNSTYGISRWSASNATLCVNSAPDHMIKSGGTQATAQYRPITPNKQHASTFYGLAKSAGDTTQSQSSNAVGNYTDEAKDKIQTMLGVSPLIAPHESDPFESAHVVGELFIINGKLYRAKTVLTVGEYINEGTNVEVVDVAEVLDGKVGDVQINGSSIVSDGVANVPIASPNALGTVKVGREGGVFGIRMVGLPGYDGEICVNKADVSSSKAGRNEYKPITPSSQHAATFYGLAKAASDTTQSQSSNAVGNYTEDAKSAISDMLNGAVQISGTDPTINAKSGVRYVCGEVLSLNFTPSATGICDVVFTSGSTPTVVTLPSTVKFPDGSFTAEADTTYEINILDGIYGAVMAWT